MIREKYKIRAGNQLENEGEGRRYIYIDRESNVKQTREIERAKCSDLEDRWVAPTTGE
jgi:hypothetical protein